MTVLDWQMDIYERLRTGLPNTTVYLEGVPESTPLPKDPTGLIKPFVIIWFGQLTEIVDFSGVISDLCGTGDTGSIIKQGNFLVQTVAPSGLSLLQLENLVRGLLTGFQPAGEGELTEGGQTTIRDPLPTGIGDTLRFYKQLFFQGLVTVDPVRIPEIPPAQRTLTLSVASPALKASCAKGHVLDKGNLIEEKRGEGKTVRRCRICVNAKARESYARRRQSNQ